MTVGEGRLHPVLTLDARNGDFARGDYDDDSADLDRIPVHAQLGLVWEAQHNAEGKPTLWLELRSSNGFHAPAADERTSPRAWYESNNLVGVVAQLAEGLNGALTYTIKASPNGVSDTTHELSISGSYKKDSGLGMLRPGFAVTWRPKGGGGVYTQATIEPGWSLGTGNDAPRLSFPAALGVGWDSFYDPGSGSRLFGSVGAALEHPFTIGSAHLSARAEALALIRDNRLRRLGGPTADHRSVRPYVTLSVTYAY